MSLTYENCIERLQSMATENGLGEARLAREEFHSGTGEFEEGEPWYELRMKMFMDWYLLDRIENNRTWAERYLDRAGPSLDPGERLKFEHLTVSMRSIFRLVSIKGNLLTLDDLARGGRWRSRWNMPTVGLRRNDIINARIVLWDGDPVSGRGTVLHPREAHEAINNIIQRAVRQKMPSVELVDHLDKMRLKLDRYSNVKTRHVYQYPDDALL